jgi:hypothetical protein
LAIIFLGLLLRLAGWWCGQGYIHFGQGDGIDAYQVATEFGLGEPRAIYLGQPNYNSRSKLPGPLWAMFCLFWCRLSGSVEGVALGIVLLNTVAIYLTYLLAERALNPAAGLWAALLLATSPWSVYYSVSVYNPEVMSFLGALLFLVLWQVTRTNRRPVVFWVPVLLLAMLQFHMSGLMLIPAVILILLLSPARLHIPWLVGGLLAGLALYIPYFQGEAHNHWQNTQGILFGPTTGRAWDRLKALSTPLSFLVTWAPRWTRSAAEYRALGSTCFGSFALFLTLSFLSAMVAAFKVSGAFQEIRRGASRFWSAPCAAFERAPGLLFFAILFLVPLATALVFGRGFHTRYCIVLLPVMMPLAAVGVLHWLTPGRWRKLFLLGMTLTLCADVWLMAAMYWSQGRRIDKGPVFVPSFRKLEAVYRCLKTHAGTDSLIQIDDDAYAPEASPTESALGDARLLKAYTRVREREAAAKRPHVRVVTYCLCLEQQAKPGEPAPAYRGNGIALIANQTTR